MGEGSGINYRDSKELGREQIGRVSPGEDVWDQVELGLNVRIVSWHDSSH